MIFYRRRKGSQRKSAPVKVTFDTTLDGVMVFTDGDTYWFIEPENDSEFKELLSAAHIAHHTGVN